MLRMDLMFAPPPCAPSESVSSFPVQTPHNAPCTQMAGYGAGGGVAQAALMPLHLPRPQSATTGKKISSLTGGRLTTFLANSFPLLSTVFGKKKNEKSDEKNTACMEPPLPFSFSFLFLRETLCAKWHFERRVQAAGVLYDLPIPNVELAALSTSR